MKILILGAGATGGYFGGRLAQSGADVTFLLRPARAEAVRRNGLVIESPKGDARLDVNVVTAGELRPDFDLVLLSCKAYDLDSAIAAISPAVRAGRAVVLPILNGLRHLDALDAAFGRARVLGGLAEIGAMLKPTGVVAHLNPLDKLRFGERDPSQAGACERFAEIVARAAFDGSRSPDILQDMWEKFVFLTTLAGMTCLFRGSVGEILETPNGEALLSQAYDECSAVAAGEGHAVRPAARDRVHALLGERGSKMTASMLRDLRAGARVEADAIVGDMLARGLALSLPMPLLRVVDTHLRVYQGQRA